jgi:hypothetical protein
MDSKDTEYFQAVPQSNLGVFGQCISPVASEHDGSVEVRVGQSVWGYFHKPTNRVSRVIFEQPLSTSIRQDSGTLQHLSSIPSIRSY